MFFLLIVKQKVKIIFMIAKICIEIISIFAYCKSSSFIPQTTENCENSRGTKQRCLLKFSDKF